MDLKSYQSFIKLTRQAYDTYRFSDLFDKGELRKPLDAVAPYVCLLRHDIDLSVANALKMAESEAEHGVKSTYTVLINGDYYNPFERRNRDALRAISALGHEIGLHFDANYHAINDEALLHEAVEKEAAQVADIVNQHVSMFSFHNTTDFTMGCKKPSYGGMTNAYAQIFQGTIQYTSDSNGYWRFRTWEALLNEKHPVIQVLTHPIWWGEENQLPAFETVCQHNLLRAIQSIRKYANMFAGQGVRENQSFLEAAKHLMADDPEKYNAAIMQYVTSPEFLAELTKTKPCINNLEQLAQVLGEKMA